jgi:hypothetical protein
MAPGFGQNCDGGIERQGQKHACFYGVMVVNGL